MRHYNKVFSILKALWLTAAVAVFLWAYNGSAQNSLEIRVIPSTTNAIPVNSSLTYSIFLTNRSSLLLGEAYVTNSLPSSAQILGATNLTNLGDISTNGTVVTFRVAQLQSGNIAALSLTARPTQAGLFTNRIVVSGVQFQTNLFLQVVTQVTNTPAVQSDLAVTVTGPGPDVYVGDWMTFGVTVTNQGTNSVSSVVLSNTFLPMFVKSINPTNRFNTGGAVTNVGTLASGASRRVNFTVLATNSGTFPLFASVTSAAEDINPNNNSAVTNIVVSSFLTNQLIATVLQSTQQFNLFNGWMEQRIAVSNASSEIIPAARVHVSGLTSTNRLVNSVGTNEGRPFVVHGYQIAPQQTVPLTLQFRVRSREQFQLDASNLQANAMNAVDLSLPSTLTITNEIRQITNVLGYMVIGFPSTNGRSYTIAYSDDIGFSNPHIVRPPVIAPANWTYWIDHGAPATSNEPMAAPMRFYKVYRNP